jgi:hypothetical protein
MRKEVEYARVDYDIPWKEYALSPPVGGEPKPILEIVEKIDSKIIYIQDLKEAA